MSCAPAHTRPCAPSCRGRRVVAHRSLPGSNPTARTQPPTGRRFGATAPIRRRFGATARSSAWSRPPLLSFAPPSPSAQLSMRFVPAHPRVRIASPLLAPAPLPHRPSVASSWAVPVGAATKDGTLNNVTDQTMINRDHRSCDAVTPHSSACSNRKQVRCPLVVSAPSPPKTRHPLLTRTHSTTDRMRPPRPS